MTDQNTIDELFRETDELCNRAIELCKDYKEPFPSDELEPRAYYHSTDLSEASRRLIRDKKEGGRTFVDMMKELYPLVEASQGRIARGEKLPADEERKYKNRAGMLYQLAKLQQYERKHCCDLTHLISGRQPSIKDTELAPRRNGGKY
jgi:hypothetical protein